MPTACINQQQRGLRRETSEFGGSRIRWFLEAHKRMLTQTADTPACTFPATTR